VRHFQILAEKTAAQARQESEQCARFHHSRAGHVGDRNAAFSDNIDQTRNAKHRARIEFQRIEEIGVHTSQQHIEALQARDGADMKPVIAHREIVAFDQQKAEIARQRRVFEIGVARAAGRQQANSRLVAICDPRKLSRKASKMARRVRHSSRYKDWSAPVKAPACSPAHIRAGRSLRSIRQDPPATIGTTPDVRSIEVEIPATGRRHSADRPQIFNASCYRRCGKRTIGNQAALTVQVTQYLLKSSARCATPSKSASIPPRRSAAANG
jgi:hypothetical protein